MDLKNKKKPEKFWLHETSFSRRKAFNTWTKAEQRTISGTGLTLQLKIEFNHKGNLGEIF